MPNKVICGCIFCKRPYRFVLNDFLDAEECYSQIVGNALRDIPGPSGKKFIEAYMMSRVRTECVFTGFLHLWEMCPRSKSRPIQIEM